MFWGRHAHKQQSSAEEDAKEEELRTTLGPLAGRAQLYCSSACLRRYLRARKWSVNKAKTMLKETLKWRASYKPEDIKWDDIAVESETGKMYRANFSDKHGRPVIIMTPANQNTDSHDGQMRQLVYTMENASFHLPVDQEQFVWIIDFTGWSISHASPLKTVRETAHILQNHYPERLAVGIMLNAPKMFEYFWKLWKPFIDPETYGKARFVHSNNASSLKVVEELFDIENMKLDFQGQYNHAEYGQKMSADDKKIAAYWEQANSHSEPTNGELGNGTLSDAKESSGSCAQNGIH